MNVWGLFQIFYNEMFQHLEDLHNSINIFQMAND